MRTFETSAIVENESSLHLDHPLAKSVTGRVHVIIVSGEDDISETEWMLAAVNNPSFDFLKDPKEDIYSIDDGKPWNYGNKI